MSPLWYESFRPKLIDRFIEADSDPRDDIEAEIRVSSGPSPSMMNLSEFGGIVWTSDGLS